MTQLKAGPYFFLPPSISSIISCILCFDQSKFLILSEICVKLPPSYLANSYFKTQLKCHHLCKDRFKSPSVSYSSFWTPIVLHIYVTFEHNYLSVYVSLSLRSELPWVGAMNNLLIFSFLLQCLAKKEALGKLAE